MKRVHREWGMRWYEVTGLVVALIMAVSTTLVGCDEPLTTPTRDDRNQDELNRDFEDAVGPIDPGGDFCDRYPNNQQEMIDEQTDRLASLSDQPYPSLRKGVEAGLNEQYIEHC